MRTRVLLKNANSAGSKRFETLSESLPNCRPCAGNPIMKTIIAWVLWCILLVLCWPVALAAIALIPLIWLVLLPFRVIGAALQAGFASAKAAVVFTARLVGGRAH